MDGLQRTGNPAKARLAFERTRSLVKPIAVSIEARASQLYLAPSDCTPGTAARALGARRRAWGSSATTPTTSSAWQRSPGEIQHKALVITYGVHATGRREVIGLDVGEAETEAFWREFLRGFRAYGLVGVRRCVPMPTRASRPRLPRCWAAPGQRCTVHVLRDMLGHAAKTQQPMIAAAIGRIFQATSLSAARQRLTEVVDRLCQPHRRWQGCWRPRSSSCWRSTSCSASTGPSCAASIFWNA
jgi:hypothetical protein